MTTKNEGEVNGEPAAASNLEGHIKGQSFFSDIHEICAFTLSPSLSFSPLRLPRPLRLRATRRPFRGLGQERKEYR